MEQGPARKPALPTVSIAAAAAAGVSLAVVAVPWLRMSVEAPSLRVALETGGSLLAVTTVGLLVRQCGLRSRADHLWLTAGLVILALTSLTVAALVVAGGWSPDKARYAMGGNLAGTLMLAIAAFAPSRKLRVHPRRILRGGGRARGRRRSRWPRCLAGVGPALRAPNANWPTFHPEIGRVIVQVVTGITLIVAAAGLTRRGEPLLRWVAVAVVLAGFAKLDYALFPPVGPTDVHLGDVLRVAAWGVLLIGVVGEMRSRFRLRAEAAIAGERRRLARELHDGVAQELAFIRRRADPPGRAAGRRRDHGGRRPRAGGLPPRDRSARPARPRAAARGAGAPRRAPGHRVRPRGAGQRARRDRGARRGPRRARPDHLRGGPQRGQPRRRAPRARRPRRARRWPSGSSTTATASATAPTAASGSPATASSPCASALSRSEDSSRWNPSAAQVLSCRWFCHRPGARADRR